MSKPDLDAIQARHKVAESLKVTANGDSHTRDYVRGLASAAADVPALLALVREQAAAVERGLALARNLDRLAPGDQHYAGLIRAALTATEGA